MMADYVKSIDTTNALVLAVPTPGVEWLTNDDIGCRVSDVLSSLPDTNVGVSLAIDKAQPASVARWSLQSVQHAADVALPYLCVNRVVVVSASLSQYGLPAVGLPD